jgi:hypothetical protein
LTQVRDQALNSIVYASASSLRFGSLLDSQYRRVTSIIEASLGFHANSLTGAMERMATQITADAWVKNMSWPFVDLTSFEVIAAATREQSGAELVQLVPIVVRGSADRWAAHSLKLFGKWFNESKEAVLTRKDTELLVTDYRPGAPLPYIFDVNVRDGEAEFRPSKNNSNSDFFLPIFAQSPPPFSPLIVHYNYLSETPADTFGAATGAREGVFANFSEIQGQIGYGVRESDHEQYHEKLVAWDRTKPAKDNPHSLFYFPIFKDTFGYRQKVTKMDRRRLRGSSGHYSDPLLQSPVVGYLVAMVAWDRYVANLLPSGVRGIKAILSNTCNQTYTYDLNGKRVREPFGLDESLFTLSHTAAFLSGIFRGCR